jgi:HTH-type transcriptional regulator, glycine betaine synthesis regulator
MTKDMTGIKRGFIEGMGQISHFWGFGNAMGQVFGLLYLNREPLGMDNIMEELGISKGSVSMTLRNLDRWGMTKKAWKRGDRKCYYEAESNFPKIAINILTERRNKEFDRSLNTVKECLDGLTNVKVNDETAFVKKRLQHMHQFFKFLDGCVLNLLKWIGRS